MGIIGKWISIAYKAVIAILAGLALLYLALLGLFSTSVIHAGEKVYFIADSPWLLLPVFALLCAGLGVLWLRKPSLPALLARTGAKGAMLLCAGALGVAWVLCARPGPVADQAAVLEAAVEMRTGECGAFVQGGYVETHPHQMGIVLLLYLLSFPFGAGNHLAVQLLNVAALLACYVLLYKINTLCSGKPQREGAVLLAAVLFFPLMLYVTFVYGTLIGLTLVLAGVWKALLLAKTGRRKHIAPAAVCLALGIQVKGNYLVFLVAAVVMLVVYALTQKRWRCLWCAVCILAAYLLGGLGVSAAGRALTGEQLDQGIPTQAWVAMGLQESPRAPGWYNEYPDSSYIVNGYSRAKTGEAALEDIRARAAELAASPHYALEFFGKKTASQWNEPTFGSLLVNDTPTVGADRPVWVQYFLWGQGALLLQGYGNLVLSLVYLGALAWLALRRERFTQLSLFLPLAFLGGFVLYMVWEAKGQYTLPFFYMLLPLAVEGYAALAARCADLVRKLKQGAIRPRRAMRTRVALFAAGLLLSVLVLGLSRRAVLDLTLKPAGDEAEYAAIRAGYQSAVLQKEETGKEGEEQA